MVDNAVQRRLAAIVVADVVGYSRLMEADEAGTLGDLKRLRKEILDPVVRAHGGRIVKIMGDGVLVEFTSAVKAVEAAIQLQENFAAANEGVLEDRRVILRIGINLGDVIGEGSDIYGDGVNIAARLEALAEPGGIAISRSVYEQVRGKSTASFSDLGEQPLKNIVDPVRVYRVEMEAENKSFVANKTKIVSDQKITIAVLPFDNMSSDPNHSYFSDGITEDIITDLSNVPGFFVIARNSTFAYKGRSTDVRQIARNLGVRYILEGSARRSENRIRVNAQLIDAAEGGGHVWAERFDRDLADIFAVQDEVTRRVVEAIAGKLSLNSISKRYHPTNLEAYDLVVRSRNLWAQSKAANDEARYQLERAVGLDANYCEAQWRLAAVTLFSWIHWGEPKEPNFSNALARARRAVEIDPTDSGARWILGYILSRERRWDEAQEQYDAALRLNPNDPEVLVFLTEFLIISGRPQEAIDAINKAFRLNPHPSGFYFWVLGFAQIANGLYEPAVSTLRREETYRSPSRRFLAAALALLGRTAEAQEEARLFLVTNPHWRISSWLKNNTLKNPKDLEFWLSAYRLAGLPE